jgi:hypothetical protein
MIRVHTSACKETVPYVGYMKHNYARTAGDHVSIVAHCSDDESVSLLAPHVTAIRCPKSPGPGQEHRMAINSALDFAAFDNVALAVIADADTAMLVDFWETIVIEALRFCDLVGAGFAPHDPTARHSWYQGFPQFTWMAMSRTFIDSGFRIQEPAFDDVPIRNDDDSTTFGLPIGTMMYRETGWELPRFCRKKGLAAMTMKETHDVHPVFSVFNLEKRPFVGHQGCSRQHRFGEPPVSSAFYDYVETLTSPRLHVPKENIG